MTLDLGWFWKFVWRQKQTSFWRQKQTSFGRQKQTSFGRQKNNVGLMSQMWRHNDVGVRLILKVCLTSKTDVNLTWIQKCGDALLLFPFTPLIELFGIYKIFTMWNHSDVGISYLCQILLLYGAKTNKTLVLIIRLLWTINNLIMVK